MYRFHRHMRTTNERRQNYGALTDEELTEYGIQPRAARTRGLPHAYDDVSRHIEKSWKAHRLTRYKVRTYKQGEDH